jgi:carbohydrate-binding DOMON domain-containing protein
VETFAPFLVQEASYAVPRTPELSATDIPLERCPTLPSRQSTASFSDVQEPVSTTTVDTNTTLTIATLTLVPTLNLKFYVVWDPTHTVILL